MAGVAFLFLAIWIVAGWLTGSIKTGFEIAFFGSIAVIALMVAGMSFNSKERARAEENGRRSAQAAGQSFARQNSAALARRKRQLAAAGPYGVDDSAWQREVRKTARALIDKEPHLLRHEYEIIKAIERGAEIGATNIEPDIGAVQSGVDYEELCAGEFQKAGWTTKLTPGSGDQGADIVANKGVHKIAVQSKWYSNPVGNKAVQEAYSAKAHYDATKAVVVTNSSFTPSAEQLAKSTGVLLLHHAEIGELESRLG